jgi:hypothetical protein
LYVGALAGSLAIVVALGFNFQQREANKRQDAAARTALANRILDRQEIAGIAQAQAILLRPSNAERNRRNLVALKSCVKSGECRKLLTTIVVRTLEPAMVPIPGSARPVKTIIVHGKPGKTGATGATGAPGAAATVPSLASLRRQVDQLMGAVRDLQSRKTDSSIGNGLDNRLTDAERVLQSVVSHVAGLDKVVGLLCRVLTPGRC